MLCLVGNKSDGDRNVAESEAKAYAVDIEAVYFETSAAAKTGIKELFDEISAKAFMPVQPVAAAVAKDPSRCCSI
jgi:predicted GTPase